MNSSTFAIRIIIASPASECANYDWRKNPIIKTLAEEGSIGLLKRYESHVEHARAFWIIFIVFFGWFAYVWDFSYGLIRLDLIPYPEVLYVFAGLLLSLSPLAYGGYCLTYFLRRSTRAYFHA